MSKDTNDKHSEVREDAREELEEEFGKADFPVSNQMEFLPDLSQGPTTEFEFGGESVTAMELAAIGGSDINFPYEDLESFLEDALEILEEEGYLDNSEVSGD